MPVSGGASVRVNRFQRFWLPLGAGMVLVLGVALGAYVWSLWVLAAPVMAAWLAGVGAVLLIVILILVLQLREARAQRDELHGEIADLRTREHALQVQAHYDGLTGLANRRLVADRFRFAAARAKRNRKSFALLTIDLHDFGTINDQYGHTAGDAVLIAIARRLVGTLRASDTVVRLSGDAFVLIVESVEDQQELAQIREKLFDALSDMVTLDTGVQVNASANLGLALYPNDGITLDDLLMVAERSMRGRKASRPRHAGSKRFNWSEVSPTP